MTEKLNANLYKDTTDMFEDFREKINEIVDVINKLQKNYNNVCIWVGEQKLKKDTIEPADPYAEQRKWIGHLVEYGNVDDGLKYGILTNIEPIYSAFPFEIDNGRDATADCWLPDESVFYKGE